MPMRYNSTVVCRKQPPAKTSGCARRQSTAARAVEVSTFSIIVNNVDNILILWTLRKAAGFPADVFNHTPDYGFCQEANQKKSKLFFQHSDNAFFTTVGGFSRWRIHAHPFPFAIPFSFSLSLSLSFSLSLSLLAFFFQGGYFFLFKGGIF